MPIRNDDLLPPLTVRAERRSRFQLGGLRQRARTLAFALSLIDVGLRGVKRASA